MTGTLTVSLALLEQFGSGLSAVAGDMKSDSKLNHFDVYDLASHELVGAIHDFTDNWEYKREKLAGKIAALGNMATNAHQTFTDDDDKLAAQIRDAIKLHG